MTSAATPRRAPRQHRAQQTVEAILGAVLRILRRGHPDSLTTNHIAEAAGVSIGSVYQYFPDKRAIFSALHQRHIDEIDRVIGAVLIQHATSSLEALVRALIEAMIEAHAHDPALYELLSAEVPHRAGGTQDFALRLHGAFRLAIAAHLHELAPARNLDLTVFVLTHMVESLCHGAVLRRPPGITLSAATEEAVHAVLAYLRS
ncbi:MAG TPA: TetR/AcrR family transcriptional regulator [Acidobacteriaceae bacterium]|jgi:AcrR family transcriptional regulator|nr:TetR/AcrR family transcriptional regulator [Acidobacteriaceae bacterium]